MYIKHTVLSNKLNVCKIYSYIESNTKTYNFRLPPLDLIFNIFQLNIFLGYQYNSTSIHYSMLLILLMKLDLYHLCFSTIYTITVGCDSIHLRMF